MAPSSSTDDEARSMVKPNCTITEHHDTLLDSLADKRYASRSEALRVAISELHQSVSEDGDTLTEELIARVEVVADRLEELDDQLSDLEDHVVPGQSQSTVGAQKHTRSSSSVTDAVATSQPGGDSGAQSQNDIGDLVDEVYQILDQNGPLSVGDIANHTNEDVVVVRRSLNRLAEYDLITTTERNGSTQYSITGISA